MPTLLPGPQQLVPAPGPGFVTDHPDNRNLLLNFVPVAPFLSGTGWVSHVPGVARQRAVRSGGVVRVQKGAEPAVLSNGTDGGYSVASSSALDITGDFSVEIWFYPAVVDGNFRMLCYRSTGSRCYGIAHSAGASNVVWVAINGVTGFPDESNPPVSTSPTAKQWNCFLVTYVQSGRTRTVYLNGRSVSSQNATAGSPTPVADPFVIAEGSGGFNYSNDRIGLVRVHTRAQSAQEALRSYALGMRPLTQDPRFKFVPAVPTYNAAAAAAGPVPWDLPHQPQHQAVMAM